MAHTHAQQTTKAKSETNAYLWGGTWAGLILGLILGITFWSHSFTLPALGIALALVLFATLAGAIIGMTVSMVDAKH